MEYLIKKSDQSIIQTFTHAPDRLQLPEQTGGDVTFVKGDNRPLDLGDYVLVEPVEIKPELDDTTKRGETSIAVKNNVVTVTKPAIAKTYDDLLREVEDARRFAYPPIGDQLDAILKQMNQDRLGGRELIQEADDILGSWLAVKTAHPKPV